MKTKKDKAKLFVASTIFKGKNLVNKIKGRGPKSGPAAGADGKIYSFTMKTIDGVEKPLSTYKGQVLLLVNTASLCGFTPQYDSLETLHKKYKDKGLRVLGFPANEFGAQEPGTDAEIKSFCKMKFGVEFDLFSKIVVKGPGINPLYQFLTTESGFDGDIGWNFAKFLVDRHGTVVGRFGPEDDPMGKKITAAAEKLLAA
jgi:glutathione peroxidase